MSEKILTASDELVTVSYSSLMTFLSCSQRWAHYKLWKTPIDEPESVGTNRQKGQALHAGLDSWYTERDIEKAVAATVAKFEYVTRWEELWEPEREKLAPTIPWLQEMMHSYAARYPVEGWDVVASEVQVLTPVFDRCHRCGKFYSKRMIRGVELVGTCTCNAYVFWFHAVIDLIIRSESGKLSAVDHKFTDRADDRFWARQHVSPQLPLYAWAASRAMEEIIEGTMLNVLVNLKKVAQRGNPYKRRAWGNIPASRMAASLETLQRGALELADKLESGLWVRNSDVCVKGPFLCPYIENCWGVSYGYEG